MTVSDEDIVLELRDLYVGYYKDLNILQDLNVKARKGQITAILGDSISNIYWQLEMID